MSDLFSGLITSKTRIKLLIRLFFNPAAKAYLRELATEFNLSSNAVREELNQLKKTHLLVSEKSGRNIYYMANQKHPLFPELKSMVSKTLGMDRVIKGIVVRLGKLETAYLMDDYAEGRDSGIIDLLIVGDVDRYHLDDLTSKTEKYIRRKIRTMVMSTDEFKTCEKTLFKNRAKLLIWESTDPGKTGKP